MSVVKKNDFRFVFGLEKVIDEISNRQILETIKTVIGEFGFVLEVIENITKNDGRKSIRINNYFIDLDNTIIELLNLTSRDYFDDIVNGVPSTFSEDTNFKENDDENSDDEEEFEIEY
jgi:hypothetical protein